MTVFTRNLRILTVREENRKGGHPLLAARSWEECLKLLQPSSNFLYKCPVRFQELLAKDFVPLYWAIARLAPEWLGGPFQGQILSSIDLLWFDEGRWFSLFGKLLQPSGGIRWWTQEGKARNLRQLFPQLKPILNYLPTGRLQVRGLAGFNAANADIFVLAGSPESMSMADNMLSERAISDFARAGKAMLLAAETELTLGIMAELARARGFDVEGPIAEDVLEGEPRHFGRLTHWMRLRLGEGHEVRESPPELLHSLETAYKWVSSAITGADLTPPQIAERARVGARRTQIEHEGAALDLLIFAPEFAVDLITGRFVAADAMSVSDTGMCVPRHLLDEFPEDGGPLDELSLRLRRIPWMCRAIDAMAEQVRKQEAADPADTPPDEGKDAAVTIAEKRERPGEEEEEDGVLTEAPARLVPRPVSIRGPMPILALSAEVGVPGEDRSGTFTAARALVIEWLGEHGFHPGEAAHRTWSAEGEHGEAITEGEGDTLWTLRFDDRRSIGTGAFWRTELTLLANGDRVLVGLRLLQVRHNPDAPIPVPAVPRLVRRLGRLGLHDRGILLRPSVWVVPEHDSNRLASILADPERTQAVILTCTADSSPPGACLQRLAKQLAGVAHVVMVDQRGAAALAGHFGPSLAPRAGRIRLYRPGFSALAFSDQHPHWPFAGSLHENLATDLAREACDIGLRAMEQEDGIPTFQKVREAVVAARMKKAVDATREEVSSDREEIERFRRAQEELQARLKLAEEDNVDLRDQVGCLEQERDALRRENADIRRAHFDTQRKLEAAWAALDRKRGPAESLPLVFPDTWDGLEDWVEAHGGGRLVVMAQATKAARASTFARIAFAYEVLHLLAHEYVAMRRRRHDDEHAKQLFEEKRARLSIEVTPSGDAIHMKAYRELYRRTHEGRRITLDMHAKTSSGSYDQTEQFRLYFNYDEEHSRIIVGHFPTHLPNSITT